MAKTYIIGHTKPDTDAVVSALALEFLYTQANGSAQNFQAVISDPLNPETSFLFKKFSRPTPEIIGAGDIQAGDSVILTDHNEASQRLDGLDESQIIEIIDHHKANLNLNTPIVLTFKPWGSSCTIVYDLMKQSGVTPDKTLAALMLSAILSDTVGFKSATTTPKDQECGQELAQLAGISDIDALTLEIFKAKSDISALTDEQIVKNDFKVFEFARKTMIDQLETVEQDTILTHKKAQLLEAMAKVKAELGVELLFVAITDVLKVNTKLLILSDDEALVAETAFGGKVSENVLDIGPKMSRKKEIAPPIEEALK